MLVSWFAVMPTVQDTQNK